MYRTPLIIKETLGQEVYDMCEKIRESSPPPQPYHMIMGPNAYNAFNKALNDECKKFFKPINS
jgi:hypothetical protein